MRSSDAFVSVMMPIAGCYPSFEVSTNKLCCSNERPAVQTESGAPLYERGTDASTEVLFQPLQKSQAPFSIRVGIRKHP
jgi:hypothetical protein